MRRATLLLPLLFLASPALGDHLDLRGIWQPLPHPSLPQRAPVLTDLKAPEREPPADAAPVILITVDTWRADRLGLYGSPRPTSPQLEAIAGSAAVFEQALAPSPWTWPTVSTLASGVLPRSHGAVLPRTSLCADATTLAETFHDAGWRTGFAGSNAYFEPEDCGYRQGFEYYFASGQADGDRVLEYVDYFLDALSDEPFFLHVHFFDPHCPYDPSDEALASVRGVPFADSDRPGEPAGTLQTQLTKKLACHGVPPPPPDLKEEDLASAWQPSDERQDYLDYYDAELAELDHFLGRLQERLRERDRWDKAWVAITGDHGEEFEEHGTVGHGFQAYDETVWVPLVIKPPGGIPGGRRVRPPVSLVDVPATLVAGAGLQPPSTWVGQDLGAPIAGQDWSPRPVVAESVYGLQEPVSLLAWGDRRFVSRGIPARGTLYAAAGLDRPALGGDFSSRLDSAVLASLLHRQLQAADAATVCEAGRIAADPAHWEQLRDLGYVDSE